MTNLGQRFSVSAVFSDTLPFRIPLRFQYLSDLRSIFILESPTLIEIITIETRRTRESNPAERSIDKFGSSPKIRASERSESALRGEAECIDSKSVSNRFQRSSSVSFLNSNLARGQIEAVYGSAADGGAEGSDTRVVFYRRIRGTPCIQSS